MIKITPYYSSGIFGENTYVLTDEASNLSAVIDPDFYYFQNGVEELSKRFNISLILLTHAHFDHIFSVQELKDATGAEICIHKFDSEALLNGKINLSEGYQNKISIKADRLLSDGEQISLGETTISVMLTSGHTRGSSCFIADDVIFSGDTLFEGSIGRTDFPGGSMKDMSDSLLKLRKLDRDYRIFPGHGNETSLFKEKKYNPFMR